MCDDTATTEQAELNITKIISIVLFASTFVVAPFAHSTSPTYTQAPPIREIVSFQKQALRASPTRKQEFNILCCISVSFENLWVHTYTHKNNNCVAVLWYKTWLTRLRTLLLRKKEVQGKGSKLFAKSNIIYQTVNCRTKADRGRRKPKRMLWIKKRSCIPYIFQHGLPRDFFALCFVLAFWAFSFRESMEFDRRSSCCNKRTTRKEMPQTKAKKYLGIFLCLRARRRNKNQEYYYYMSSGNRFKATNEIAVCIVYFCNSRCSVVVFVGETYRKAIIITMLATPLFTKLWLQQRKKTRISSSSST